MSKQNLFRFDPDKTDFWLDNVRCVESPNYDERPHGSEIDLLVIHAISLPPSKFGGGYIEQLFTNSLDPNQHPYFQEIRDLNVSSHLLIDRNGELTQFVALNHRAWHAGDSEFCGRKVCNDFSIGIELEGCDDSGFESAQYAQLAGITRFIQQQWPVIQRSNIVGHSEISPGRKTDPGPCFDWDRYFQLIDVS